MTRHRIVRVAALAALAVGCGPARLDSFLYDPLKAPAGGYTLSTDVISAHQDVFIDSTDGVKIHVAFVPAKDGAHPDLTMLYFHGQSNDIGTSWPRVELLYPLGVNLAAVDPRGYGLSTGEPSERGIHDDLLAVWDQLPAKVAAVDPDRIIIYGRSLGAAFATDLAASRAPVALITESAFASIKEMVRDGAYVDLPPGFVADSRWDNLAKIPAVAAPYLAIHGLADDYVRYQYSQMLAAAHLAAQTAKTQLVLVPNANHGDAHGPPPTLNEQRAGSYVALLHDFLGLAP